MEFNFPYANAVGKPQIEATPTYREFGKKKRGKIKDGLVSVSFPLVNVVLFMDDFCREKFKIIKFFE